MNKYKSLSLQNGAKLYYTKNNLSKTTMTHIVFNSGSRFDSIPGLAHFTEHLFLSGTKKKSKSEISKEYFEFINANMATNVSKIFFMGNVLTKSFKKYLSLVAECVTETVFSEKAVKDEMKVITQEIAAYKDNFQLNAMYYNDYFLTNEDVYKYSELGTEKTIATIKSKDVKNFVKEYFVQENMEVYVASPLKLSAVKKFVEQTLSTKINKNKNFTEIPNYRFEIKNDKFYKIITKDIGKSYLFINFIIPCMPKDFKRTKQIELLVKMLNNQSDGIMNDLRWGGDENLTYGAWFGMSQGKEHNVITFYTECGKSNLNPIIEKLATFLNNIQQNGFKQKTMDFEKDKDKYLEDAKEINLRSEFHKLYDFKLYGHVRDEKQMRKYTAETTLEDCNKLFKEMINSNISLFVYGDATQKDVVSKTDFKKMFNKK